MSELFGVSAYSVIIRFLVDFVVFAASGNCCCISTATQVGTPMIARYTRPAMGRIWSDENKYRCWLTVEVAASQALATLRPRPAVRRRRHPRQGRLHRRPHQRDRGRSPPRRHRLHHHRRRAHRRPRSTRAGSTTASPPPTSSTPRSPSSSKKPPPSSAPASSPSPTP